MSYALTIVVPPVPDGDEDAWKSVEQLAGLTGPRAPVLQTLHDRLVARFPCISTLEDDQVDDGVWSDGPLINNFGHRCAVLGVSGAVSEVLPFLVSTSTDLGLVVFDPQRGTIHRPGAPVNLPKAPPSMKSADVRRLLREGLDPCMTALGFRFTKGEYVRRWDGGNDCLAWGLVNHAPVFRVGGFATLRVDAVEELISPHIGYSKPEYAAKAWSINVNLLAAFEDGPATLRRDEVEVTTAAQVSAYATELSTLVRERIDPFWRSIRSPADLRGLPAAWRRFWPSPTQLHDVALAFLCADVSQQRSIETEALAAFPAGDLYHGRIQSLVADLRARREQA